MQSVEMRRVVATIECPKRMVGRVIGKNGETIKALQTYTGSLIQVNQVEEPCQITISGTPPSLSLATSMVNDIIKGTFKGFALLRQMAAVAGQRGPTVHVAPAPPPPLRASAQPMYAPGYGLIPPSQLASATTGDVAGGIAQPQPASSHMPLSSLAWLQDMGMPSNYGLVSNGIPNHMLPVFGAESTSMYRSVPQIGNLQGHAMDASPLDMSSSSLSGGLSTDVVTAQPTLSSLPNGACIANIYSMLNAFPSPEFLAAAQSQSNLGSSISLAYLMDPGAHSEQ